MIGPLTSKRIAPQLQQPILNHGSGGADQIDPPTLLSNIDLLERGTPTLSSIFVALPILAHLLGL
jgi:hypothetical protein